MRLLDEVTAPTQVKLNARVAPRSKEALRILLRGWERNFAEQARYREQIHEIDQFEFDAGKVAAPSTLSLALLQRLQKQEI